MENATVEQQYNAFEHSLQDAFQKCLSSKVSFITESSEFKSYPWYFQSDAKLVNNCLHVRIHDECGVEVCPEFVRVFIGEGFPLERLPFFYFNRIAPLSDLFDGAISIHASAVEMKGEGTLFVGNTGVGKSTIAFSLVSGGARLVSEDMTTIKCVDNQVLVKQGPPWIKLCHDMFNHFSPNKMGEAVWGDRDGKKVGLFPKSFSEQGFIPAQKLVELSKIRQLSKSMSEQEILKRLMSSLRYGRLAYREFGESTWKVLNEAASILLGSQVFRENYNKLC